MSAVGRHADASACGTCRKAVEAGEAVVHEECAARAALLQAPDYPDYEDLLDLTDDERRALPARFHTPQFDSLGKPNAWLCRVCWGDGWVTQWPCKAAQENGTQVFTHAFVDDSMTELSALRARVADLEAERHSTNEALSDAVEQLRVQQARIAELEAVAGKVDSDFFQPGYTYTDVDPQYDWKFRCDLVTTHPEDGERTALGWRFFNGVWNECAYGEDDWDVQQFVGAKVASKTAPALPPVPQQRQPENSDDDGPTDCIAISDDWRTRCQPEDPHTSPLHHDYALGRDLPAIPEQRDGEAL